MYVSVWECISMRVVYMSVCECVYVCVYIYMNVYVCMCMNICMCICVCVSVCMCVWMSVCAWESVWVHCMYVCGFFKDLFIIICKYTVAVFRHTRRGSQILLRMVVSHHVVAGIWTLDLRKSSQVLSPTEPSHQPLCLCFKTRLEPLKRNQTSNTTAIRYF
jgi:nuclear pore complex protein Nup62